MVERVTGNLAAAGGGEGGSGFLGRPRFCTGETFVFCSVFCKFSCCCLKISSSSFPTIETSTENKEIFSITPFVKLHYKSCSLIS